MKLILQTNNDFVLNVTIMDLKTINQAATGVCDVRSSPPEAHSPHFLLIRAHQSEKIQRVDRDS